MTRFDRSLYSSVSASDAATAANPYPGDVDPMATASIRRGPVPAADVEPRSLEDGHSAYESSANPYQQNGYRPSGNQAALPYDQPVGGQVRMQPIQPGPVAQYRPPAAQPQVQRQQLAAPTLAPATVDPVQTASVPRNLAPGDQPRSQLRNETVASLDRPALPRPQPTTPAPQARDQASSVPAALEQQRTAPASQPAPVVTAGNEKGWTATGGTAITLREGETLHNLSKRYGVPVKAIMSTNGITDASTISAGSRVVIPTYVYSPSAPVSAPDSDPTTYHASSDRGSLYQPKAVPTPTRRPEQSLASARTDQSLPRVTPQQMAANPPTATPPQQNSPTRVASSEPGVDRTTTGSTRPEASAPPRQPAPAAKLEKSIETAAVEANAPARTGIEEFRWPVRGRVISSFGDKTANGRNDGIDISVPEGTAVKAAENGVVVYAGDELEGFGNLVLIRHAGGWITAYGHNSQIDVKRGDEVRRGQTIARSGKTGKTDMPKLHFELRKGSTPVDPMKHLAG